MQTSAGETTCGEELRSREVEEGVSLDGHRHPLPQIWLRPGLVPCDAHTEAGKPRAEGQQLEQKLNRKEENGGHRTLALQVGQFDGIGGGEHGVIPVPIIEVGVVDAGWSVRDGN